MLAQVAELDADGRFRKSGEQRILIELLLLRFAYLESTVSIEDVMAALGGRGPGGGGNGGGGGGPPAPRPSPDAPAARPFERPAASSAPAAPISAAPSASPTAPGDGPARAAAPRAEADPAPTVASPTPSVDASASAEVRAEAAPAPATSSLAASVDGPAQTSANRAEAAPEPVIVSTASVDDPELFPAPHADAAPAPAAESATAPSPAASVTVSVAEPASATPAPPADASVHSQPEGGMSSGSAYDDYDLPPLVLPHEAEFGESAPQHAASVAAPTIAAPTIAAPTTAGATPASAPAAATPPASVDRGGDTGPIDGARLRRAWTGILQEGDGLPPGMGMLVRAAQLSAEGRTVKLTFTPNHPALEKLSAPGAKRGLEDALARRLGGAVTLELAAGGAAAAIDPRQGRITAESARKDRLARLMEGEPVLSAAVQAWDLELVD
jgi:hypothetical protein